MTERVENRWQHFWNRGSWWKALALVVVYWAIFQLVSLGVTSVFQPFIDPNFSLSDPGTVFFGIALPIIVAAAILLAFGASLGWVSDLFRRESSPGARWMWIAVALVLIPVVIRLFATRWSAYSVGAVLALLLLGLCVGFAEELLTRGFVVKILRSGGHGERAVLVISSAYFALLHSGNIISGLPVATVLLTVVYTFGFGAMMYLSLRVTGRLVWAILLHAATDPTTMLATGGIDTTHSASAGSDALLGVAGVFNVLYVAFALLAIWLVKKRDRVMA